MSPPDLTSSAIALFAALVAVTTDLRGLRIPNILTLPLLLCGIAYHTFAEGGPGTLASGSGLFAGFIVLLPLYVIGAMGAGDLKLSAALGAWLGPLATLETLFVACALTAAASFVMQLLRRDRNAATRGENLPRIEELSLRSDRRTRLVPFAVPLAAGVLIFITRSQGLM